MADKKVQDLREGNRTGLDMLGVRQEASGSQEEQRNGDGVRGICLR